MEIQLSKQAFKKLKILSISDTKHAILIKEKLLLISQKKVRLVQLKGFKGLFKERVGKYRIIFNYEDNITKIIILEKRDLVYSLVNNLF